ncbi:TetR/AcrR family transcriptional regulator C-terminal domain-containing protein [Streptomyces sp. NPDC088141]|uniref:TetR/AcrR family transcriptional regulator C-terminal domain-containing protein n=1 Tax=Streptomyces sp. NPDC088141 TaxID=3155179 RepID=UPI003427BC85
MSPAPGAPRASGSAGELGEAGVAHLGPNTLRLSEDMLTDFEEAGFSLEQADRAVNTVMSYVIGVSTAEAARLTMLARSGRSEQEWTEHLWPAAERAVQPPYPRLRRLYASRHGEVVDGARNDNFRDGLACVPDGLEARLPDPGSPDRL